MNSLTPSSSDILLRSLQAPSVYPHDVTRIELLETHISWVLLTGPYAYKIKKPVNLGFLDFSGLEQRRLYCEEELRLNRRLAPGFYLELTTITGTPDNPSLNGLGAPIEYAVKMKQFPQEALLSHRIHFNQLSHSDIDAIAECLAEFHAHVAVADPSTPFATADLIHRVVMDNFQHLPTVAQELIATQDVARLKRWTEEEHSRCVNTFTRRKTNGLIRECHGDLHLGNIALVDGEIVIFDCIEFNDSFRWIDVVSEIAFVVMDLMDRGAPAFAWRFLNRYLELTGDYEGLQILRFYLTYRAMVRAKVMGIRLTQAKEKHVKESDHSTEFRKYVALAGSFIHGPQPMLFIMHGLSGSGKTTVSQALLESLGAIRIRSDIERKRLIGLSPNTKTDSQHTFAVYSETSTGKTYAHLEKLARDILQSGHSVIVDATFLKRTYRESFVKMARDIDCAFLILDIRAPVSILRQRVVSRQHEGHDASEADLSVLEQQLSLDEPFSRNERPFVVEVDTEDCQYHENMVQAIQQRRNVGTAIPSGR